MNTETKSDNELIAQFLGLERTRAHMEESKWITADIVPGLEDVDPLNPYVTNDLILHDGCRVFTGYYSFRLKAFIEFNYSDIADVIEWQRLPNLPVK